MTQAHPFVRLKKRLAVNAFTQQRYRESGLTPNLLARRLNLRHAGSVTTLLRGRQLLSRSKDFDPLCDFLGITPEERASIRAVEQEASSWRPGRRKDGV